MKTIFEKSTREEVIKRIHTLNENSIAQWGKMNIYQMLKHCTLWEEMMQGKKEYKQGLIGRLFGRIALNNVLKDEKGLQRNTPTIPHLKIKETGDVTAQKKEWIGRIEQYGSYDQTNFVHVFFGKMSNDQVGQLVYKHIDHHLRQFNA